MQVLDVTSLRCRWIFLCIKTCSRSDSMFKQQHNGSLCFSSKIHSIHKSASAPKKPIHLLKIEHAIQYFVLVDVQLHLLEWNRWWWWDILREKCRSICCWCLDRCKIAGVIGVSRRLLAKKQEDRLRDLITLSSMLRPLFSTLMHFTLYAIHCIIHTVKAQKYTNTVHYGVH